MQHNIVQYWTYSSWFCLKNHGHRIIWENKHKYVWIYGINPVCPPVAEFTIYFPALAVAEFDRSSSLGETACRDEWQVFVASGDDHARGKYTKRGETGKWPTNIWTQTSLLSNLSKGQTKKEHIWNVCMLTTVRPNFKFFLKYTIFGLRTNILWANDEVLKCSQIPGTSVGDASEAPAATVLWPIEQ